METISELRGICQNTRPAIFSDFLSRWYYKVSIYFTWVCLKFGMSANQVTVFSGFVAILGGGLLVSDSKILTIVGVLCFHLFCVLDMSDGEVARYRNQGGVAGHFLDWFMHFVSSTAFMFGLFVSSIENIDSLILVAVGLLAVVTPILEKSVQNSGWTVICWTRLRNIKNNSESICNGEQESIAAKADHTQYSILYRRIRFLLLSPLQDHWLPTIVLIIASIDLIFNFMGNEFIDYKLLLLFYIGVVGPIHIYLNVRKMVLSGALVEGYQKLVCPTREIKLPEDDFLG